MEGNSRGPRAALGALLAVLCTRPGAAILHAHESLESGLPTRKCSWELQVKDIDILVFGSTGYMGSRIAQKIVERAEGRVRVGIASRNGMKLWTQWNSMKKSGLKAAALPSVQVAHLGNGTSLMAMAQRARIIVTAAGPYQRNRGENLVQHAIRACAHYIDISVEGAWRGGVLKSFDEAARKRGLVILQGAGFVSAASDLVALHAAKSMEVDGSGPPDEIFVSVTKMNGLPTGGALASITKEDREIKDPYLLAPEATEAQRVDTRLEGHEEYGENDDLSKKIYYWPGGRVEPLLLRRTMVKEYPDNAISVKYATTDELFSNLLQFYKDTIAKRGLVAVKPPSPGEGPPTWLIEDGSWALEAIGMRNHPPKRTRVVLRGVHDPAVAGTVEFTSMLALSLHEDGPYRGEVGYLTPSRAVNPATFIQKLKSITMAGGEKWLEMAHGFDFSGGETLLKGAPGEVLEPAPEEEVPILRAYTEERLAARSRSMEGMPFDVLKALMPQPGSDASGEAGLAPAAALMPQFAQAAGYGP